VDRVPSRARYGSYAWAYDLLIGHLVSRVKMRVSPSVLGALRAGPSMLARRLTTILPSMTLAEALQTTRMHRVASLTDDRLALVTTRPFRAPPHPITEVGVIVGGQVPLPGEGSRAHPGVL
jgi:magnesium chelatase family protein